MKRRAFFGSVFSGLAITKLSAKSRTVQAGDIPKRPFGRTGESLTVIGQGGARLALMRDKGDAKAHVRRAYELGLNYFDCAHSYWEGRSEEVYGEALSDVRKEVFLTSKSTQRTAEGAERELDKTLERLKTDYLDLWQIHGVNTIEEVDQIFGPGGAIEGFEWAKQKGKCRFVGFTGHHDPQVHLRMLELYAGFDSIMMPLHAADPHYLSFETMVLPVAVEKGIGIQAMKCFGNAFLLRALNPRECLEYVLSLPVHCASVGCSTLGQLEENVRIARGFEKLSKVDMDLLRQNALTGTGILKGAELEYWKRS